MISLKSIVHSAVEYAKAASWFAIGAGAITAVGSFVAQFVIQSPVLSAGMLHVAGLAIGAGVVALVALKAVDYATSFLQSRSKKSLDEAIKKGKEKAKEEQPEKKQEKKGPNQEEKQEQQKKQPDSKNIATIEAPPHMHNASMRSGRGM